MQTHGLSEDGVSVSGNDLSLSEGSPDELDNLLVGGGVSNLLLHVEDESEDLLVGKTVEGSGETAEGGGVGEEGVGEGGSDEVCRELRCQRRVAVDKERQGRTGGVSGDVSTLVVSCRREDDCQLTERGQVEQVEDALWRAL